MTSQPSSKMLQNIVSKHIIQKQPTELLCIKKGFLKFFKILRKALVPEPHLYLRPSILLKKRLWHRCFHENFTKLPRTPFLQNTSGQLFLIIFKLFLKFQISLTLQQQFGAPKVNRESVRWSQTQDVDWYIYIYKTIKIMKFWSTKIWYLNSSIQEI